MAAEWLRADQIAAMTLRAAQVDDDLRPLSHSQLGKVLQQDVPALAAQDGRWRALVGELLAAVHDAPITNVQTALWLWHDGDPCTVTVREPTARLLTALNEAQAALAAAPPAPRGATDG